MMTQKTSDEHPSRPARRRTPSPRQIAVALRYLQDKDRAPRVVAKGYGAIAERIRELAKKNGVPVRQDTDLVELLVRLNLDQLIPPDLYRAVAEILAFLYRANQTAPHRP